jgi:hypothetical protein
LPTVCDCGVKKERQGILGYLDVLTSASVHDSQVAIPLMKLTSGKVTYCYDLMDAAYDAA